MTLSKFIPPHKIQTYFKAIDYWFILSLMFFFSGNLTNVLRWKKNEKKLLKSKFAPRVTQIMLMEQYHACPPVCSTTDYNGHFSLCLWTGKGTVFLVEIEKNREESPCLNTERCINIMKGHFLVSLFEGLYMVIKNQITSH